MTEPPQDMKGRSVRGAASTLSGNVVKFSLTLGTSVVLARILTPEDFGLVAMALTVAALLQMFTDLGLGMLTVQRPTVSDHDLNTYFRLNVLLGLGLSVIAAMVAPGLAAFFGDERLVGIALAMAPSFLVAAAGVQHQAILTREFRFGSIVTIQLASMAISSALAIGMVLLGAGYWGLVVKQVAEVVLRTSAAWIACPWRPRRLSSWGSVREAVSFGANLTGFNFVNYFSRNLDNVLIGKFHGSASLGLYTRAYHLLLLPLQQLNAPIGTVAIPALSRLAGKPVRYRRAYLRLSGYIGIGAGCITALLIVCADWVIELLLGRQWMGAVNIFRWLGIVGFLQPIGNTTGWLFITQDRTHDMFRWGVVGASLSAASFVAGLPWGPEGVAAAYALSGVALRVPLLFWYVGRKGPVSTSDLWRSSLLPLLSAVVVGGTALALRGQVDGLPLIVRLGLISLCAMGVLAILVLLLPPASGIRSDLRDAAGSLRVHRPAEGEPSSEPRATEGSVRRTR